MRKWAATMESVWFRHTMLSCFLVGGNVDPVDNCKLGSMGLIHAAHSAMEAAAFSPWQSSLLPLLRATSLGGWGSHLESLLPQDTESSEKYGKLCVWLGLAGGSYNQGNHVESLLIRVQEPVL